MALNFTEAIWISCELAQVSVSRGHRYLSLIQKDEPDPILGDEGQIIAQSDAVIWAREYQILKRKLGTTVEQILQPGLEVLIKAKVEYHERYGFKLHIVEIDPAYTVGKLALQRQALIEKLQAKGLLERNKLLPIAPVLQRIAVISSLTAAGYQDFRQQLEQNAYGYHIGFTLFDAAMQGERVRLEVSRRIKEINRRSNEFDCVVLIRGGGAKLDLIAFDEEELCVALANCKLPLLTGIGHDIDETIADLLAHQSLKTPTAVAEWIIQYNLQFEVELLELARTIETLADNTLTNERFKLERITQQIPLNVKTVIHLQDRMLEYIAEELPKQGKRILSSAQKNLEHRQNILDLLNPAKILERGFSITMHNGKVAKAGDLKEGHTMETILADGKVKSKVIKEK
jgi:exodeoxyribonuclease VII large subunit